MSTIGPQPKSKKNMSSEDEQVKFGASNSNGKKQKSTISTGDQTSDQEEDENLEDKKRKVGRKKEQKEVEEEEEEIMTSVRLPVKQQSSSEASSERSSSGGTRGRRSRTVRRRQLKQQPIVDPDLSGLRSPVCGDSVEEIRNNNSEKPKQQHLSSEGGTSLNASFGGNDADDEDEDDSVFAHVIIGSRVPLNATLRPRSDGEPQKKLQHRQSNSFELATSPQQRQKHLRFLRTVHSAQARINETLDSTSTGSVTSGSAASLPPAGNKVKPPIPLLSVEVHGAHADKEKEDDDVGDELSVQEIGKRIRKLSSRTIEFCDSIDNLTVMGNEMQRPAATPSSIASQDPARALPTTHFDSIYPPAKRALERGYSDNPQASLKDTSVPQFSLSVESDASHRSHDSASTVITNTTLTHSSAQSGVNSSSAMPTHIHQMSEPRQIPIPSSKSHNIPTKEQSSSITGALTSWASSLMAMRHRSSSETRNKRQQGRDNSNRSTSQERPLAMRDNQPLLPLGKPPPKPPRLAYNNQKGTRNVFKRQDTPQWGTEAEPTTFGSTSMSFQRRGALHARLSNRLTGFSDGSSSSQSFGSLDHMTPPSIVCTEHEEDSSRNTSNSSNATPIGLGSSLDDALEPECDTPVMDEFAQFLNASIHPPNELSVPRCYPDHCPSSPTLLHPMSMPGSRRSSATRGTALACASYRNARSLSLGYQQQQLPLQSRESPSPGPKRSAVRTYSRGSSSSSVLPPGSPSHTSPAGSRPVLRRESAQDFGDDVEVDNPKLKLNLPKQPPDLKIELLSETSSATSPSTNSPFMPQSSLSPYSPCDGGEPFPLTNRRPSHCGRTPPIARNKSAPATPLSRSITNMQNAQRMARSPSKDGYLMVPERLRGSSLPEGREHKQESDLYRLRQFTINNKRIVQRSDSLQPRRSVGSVHSSASSLSHSYSGRSSLRSSTEDDDPCSSRNSSMCTPRYTVLMLGASEVGKTLLTNQFMSCSDVGSYSALAEDEYDEKSVSVLLEGEEAELVFIDHPSSEISCENAMATYIPDAMVICYSVVNGESLSEAENILQYLWRTNSMDNKAIIMVGNKTDLVRTRVVNIVDAKAIATSYDCKYTETSAALNHNVDELLVGILTQIRLKLKEKSRFNRRAGKVGGRRGLSTGGSGSSSGGGGVSRRKSAGVRVKGILDKVLGVDSKSKSCDDLHVL